MADFPDENQIAGLLERHAQLEATAGDNDSGNWLSGWQCVNPCIEQINDEVENKKESLGLDQYHYISEDSETLGNLAEFHDLVDPHAPEGFLCGAGSSTLIFTFCAWLRTQGITQIHYVQPMFYTVHYALKIFNIATRPINSRHGFEAGFRVELPIEKSVLLLTDPVWYAGIPLPHETIDKIRNWQQRTKSIVFVDGSFQYSRWDNKLEEATANLNADLTIRLICPTKALAAHGFRFAYATVPTSIRSQMAHIYSNIYGSVALDTLAFGRALPKLIIDRQICSSLMGMVAQRHHLLRTDAKIEAVWQAQCGYFIYEKINISLPNNSQLLGGDFFQQRRYQDHARINLLSPSIDLFN